MIHVNRLQKLLPYSLIIFSGIILSLIIIISYKITVLIVGGIIFLYVFSLTVMRNSSLPIKMLIVWMPIQSFTLTLVWQYLSLTPFQVRILIGLKDVTLLSLLLYLVLKDRIHGLIPVDYIGFAYFAIATLYLIAPSFILPERLGFIPSLAGYRRIVLPILLYSLGRFTPFTRGSFKTLLRTFIFMGIIIIAFGLLEYFLFSPAFWKSTINMVGYKAQIQGAGPGGIQLLSLERRWITTHIQRLKSFFTHPNGVAYYSPLLILFFMSYFFRTGNVTKRKTSQRILLLLTLLLFLLAQILTLGRGGLLVSMLGILLLLIKHKKIILIPILGIFAYFGYSLTQFQIVDAMLFQSNPLVAGGQSQFSRRVISGIQSLLARPLGYGLGQGGPWGRMLGGGEGYVGSVGESGYLQIGNQVGFFGMLCFAIFIFSLIMGLKKYDQVFNENEYLKVCLTEAVFFSTVGYAIAQLFASPLLGFTIIGTYWIFAGLAVQLITQATPPK